MKRFIEGMSRTQGTLLPECLDDYISEENPVRVVAQTARTQTADRVTADRLQQQEYCIARPDPKGTLQKQKMQNPSTSTQ